ncbi:hypothetical protein [Nostoc sp.]|uniref:hypothetical protein n=1 Tax=Nostoc sp. TaxID=1180 RepID=UPI002FFCF919
MKNQCRCWAFEENFECFSPAFASILPQAIAFDLVKSITTEINTSQILVLPSEVAAWDCFSHAATSMTKSSGTSKIPNRPM